MADPVEALARQLSDTSIAEAMADIRSERQPRLEHADGVGAAPVAPPPAAAPEPATPPPPESGAQPGSQGPRPAIPAAAPADASPPDLEYALKPLVWADLASGEQRRLAVITQNRNGPCPLLALCNVLLLRGDIELRPDLPSVSFERLVALLGDYLVRNTPRSSAAAGLQPHELLNYEYTMDEILQVIPSLQHGLDVNVHFASPQGFELTAALSLFDMFRVRLVHGWVCDPDDPTHAVVASKFKSYNAAVEAIVSGDVASSQLTSNTNTAADGSADRAALETAVVDGIACSQFLSATASQLTPHGLRAIDVTLRPGELCIFFRNNHFSTLFKHPSLGLFTLVTDQGFAKQASIVWESMAHVDGNSDFFSGLFEPYVPSEEAAAESAAGIDPTLVADTNQMEDSE
nr:Ubiquitin carboxyl-terminal hydrolase MINDY-2 [Polyrhizophydium stewartii]